MSGFTWVEPPENISKGLEEYEAKVKAALHAIASKWGQEVQDSARQNGPWEDRTGNARSGIFYAVDGLDQKIRFGEIKISGEDLSKLSSGTIIDRGRKVDKTDESGNSNTLIIVISHSVFYGKYLELSNGGKYAIIMSEIEANLPRLEANVRAVFKG